MKEFWNMIQMVFAAVGGWLGYYLGGCDGLLLALVAFAAADYLTGVMCAVSDRKLSSNVGFKGICRKVLIFPPTSWMSMSSAPGRCCGRR